MKTKPEPPPELASHDVAPEPQLLELPAPEPLDDPPPELPVAQPKPPEPFLRRG